jgi:hypothetical protein
MSFAEPWGRIEEIQWKLTATNNHYALARILNIFGVAFGLCDKVGSYLGLWDCGEIPSQAGADNQIIIGLVAFRFRVCFVNVGRLCCKVH